MDHWSRTLCKSYQVLTCCEPLDLSVSGSQLDRDCDLLRWVARPLVDSHFRTNHSCLWQLTQGHNSMANVGPSRAMTESRFVVVVIMWGPSMAIIESQIQVVATWFETKHGRLWWPNRGRDDSAGIKHDPLWRTIQGRGYVIWVHVESELDGRSYHKGSGWSEDMTPHLPCNFSEAVVSSFEDTWNIGKQHVYPDTAPLMPVQHIPSSLGHAIFRLTQIVTIDLNFLKRSTILVINLVFKPQSLISINHNPTAWI